MSGKVFAVAALLLGPGAAAAHGAETSALGGWQPWVAGGLATSALVYTLGLARLWCAAGLGRGVSRLRALAFAGGWAALALALLSPLDALALRSFAAHMLQHELMMVVAAPLLCLARPLVAWTWALPPASRRRAGALTRHAAWARPWSALSAPAAAWTLHAAALWGWHLPAAYDAALRDDDLHLLQHASFLGSALLFWWAVLRPARREAPATALAMLFTTMLQMGALGALLALSPRPWYAHAAPAPFGLDALADQQLGGLVMWVPAGLAYLAAALAQAAHWLDAARPLRDPAR